MDNSQLIGGNNTDVKIDEHKVWKVQIPQRTQSGRLVGHWMIQ